VDLLGQLSNPSDQVREKIHAPSDRIVPAIAASHTQDDRRPHRLTEAEVDALIESYRHGATVKVLAVEHHVHRATVMEHLRRNGIPRTSAAMRWSPEQVSEAAHLYEQGSSVRTLGDVYGLDPSTIARRLKRAGVKLRPGRGATSA
jgi:lambda repressor-like predicted transcriptional regulator